MAYSLVGQSWNPEDFGQALVGKDLSWVKGVTVHHTAAPSLAQRPNGLTDQHVRNLRDYYRNDLGWSAGPHLFIDDHRVMGLSSMERPGTHAKSFNRTHIGIEVLGNYDHESPSSGRGAKCWKNTATAVRILLAHLGLSVSAINGHRDDSRTQKTCPGKLVDLNKFRAAVSGTAFVDLPDTGVIEDHSEEDMARISSAIAWQALKLGQPDPDITKILESIEWQLGKLR